MEENEKQKVSVFSRLTGVITKPVATFGDISERPDYLVPIILMILTSVIVVSVVTPIALEKAFEEMPEEVPEIARTLGYIMGIVSGVVMPLIIWLITAALIHFFAGILGGEGEFKPLLSVLGYAGIPNYIKSIVVAIYVGISGNFQPKLGLEFFLKSEDPASKVISVILSNVEPFNLWYIVLVIVGVSVAKKMPRKRAAIAFAIWWIIITAIQMAVALLRGVTPIG